MTYQRSVKTTQYKTTSNSIINRYQESLKTATSHRNVVYRLMCSFLGCSQTNTLHWIKIGTCLNSLTRNAQNC